MRLGGGNQLVVESGDVDKSQLGIGEMRHHAIQALSQPFGDARMQHVEPILVSVVGILEH